MYRSLHVRRTLQAVLSFVALLLVTRHAHAQTDTLLYDAADQKGTHAERGSFSPEPYERFDAASGNLVLTFTDLVLPGNAGRSLQFQRTYNNQRASMTSCSDWEGSCLDGGTRSRWSFGFPGMVMRVIERTVPPGHSFQHDEDFYDRVVSTTPLFVMADGTVSRTVYVSDPNINSAQTAEVIASNFYRYDRGLYRMRMPDGTTCEYDATTGRLKWFRDPFDNLVELEWNPTAVTVRQHLGSGQTRVITLTIDAEARVQSMSYDNRTWTYIYEFVQGDHRDITQVVPPIGPGWAFQYATGPLPIQDFFETDGLVSVTTPHGGVIEYEYGEHVVNSESGPPTSQTIRNITLRRTRDRAGITVGEWQFQHGPPYPGWQYSATTTIITPSARIVYEHDQRPGTSLMGGRVTFTARSVLAAPNVLVERQNFVYDNVPVVQYSLGIFVTPEPVVQNTLRRDPATGATRTYLTQYSYSSANFGDYHHPSQIVENNNLGIVRTTTRTYQHETGAAYILGLPSTETVSINGGTQFIRSWGYDPAGTGFQVSSTTAGLVTQYEPHPNGSGNLALVRKPNGKETSFAYGWGVVSEITTPEHVTSRVINQNGTVASETQGGRTTEYVYDELSRVRFTRPPGYPGLSAETQTTYDNAGAAWVTTTRGTATTTTALDPFGRPTSTTNSMGVRTATRYDGEGRPIFEGYPVKVADPDIGTDVEYDPLGRVTRRTNPDDTFSLRTYGFDANGLSTITITDEEDRISTQTWLPFGHPDDARLVTVTDADAKSWQYAYNVAGQLVNVTAQDGISRTWVYNQTTFLLDTEIHPESGTTSYTYLAGVLRTKTDARGTVFTYTYDGNDRVRTITAGSVVTDIRYEAGTDNRQAISRGSTSSSYLYDSAGRLEQRQDAIDGKLFNTRFEYFADDSLRAITYPTGRRVEYENDTEGRPFHVFEPTAGRDYASTMLYHPSGALQSYTAGNLIQTQITYDPERYWVQSITAGGLQLTYSNYDTVGNVRTLADSRFGTQTFTYDPLDRLSMATGPYGSSPFLYDVHGNRANVGQNTYEYQPGTLRLIYQNTLPFIYDNNGNLETGSGTTYTYTLENMLASAATPGGTATYAYDGNDQRVRETVGTTTTYYLRGAGDEVLTEWKNPGTATGGIRDYVYAGSRLLSAVAKPTTSDPNSTCGIIVPGGATVTVTATSGQDQCFKFRGTAARKVSALITAVSPAYFNGVWYLSIFKPDGAPLGYPAGGCCGDIAVFADTRELPVTGEYTLIVDPYGAAGGTFTIELFDVAHVTGPITANGPAVPVALTVPGQNGELTFSGTAGQTVSVTITSISPSIFLGNWYLWILKPDDSPLGGPGGYGFGCCGDPVAIRDAIVLPVDGMYKVVLDPAGTRLGTVDVRLYAFAHDTRPIVPGGGPLTVQLLSPGQNGLLTFTGVTGQKISLHGTNGSFSGHIGCDTWVSILQPPSNTEMSASKTCMEGGGFMEPVTLTAAGTHTVFVDPSNAVTGTLTLQLYDVTTDVSGTLTVGGGAVPVTIGNPGQQAAFTFTGTTGQQATVRITSNAMGWTTVTLKKDGTTVTTATLPFESFDLTTQTLEAGTYTVIVDPAGANTGSLNLAVTTP